MAISDKTRKVLWGRSGNRCAFCRLELVVTATSLDQESVVGEECHIISGQPLGPRHHTDFQPDQLDSPDNLILLCRVHHKMIDDQCETYTAEAVRLLKHNHEKWVSSTLSESDEAPPFQLRRVSGETATHLVRLTSGGDLMKVVGSAYGFEFKHDEPQSDEEVELIASFLQEAQDWGDLGFDLEVGSRVEAAFRMGQLIQELERHGFWVFGAREVQRLEGGIGPPSAFPVALLHVTRPTNPEIIRVDANEDAGRTK